MRLRISRPRKLSTWLLLALALMLVPQFIGAGIGISRQQTQINEARDEGRAVATRLGRIAHLQSTLDATEDAVLRHGKGSAGPRVRGTLARANADVLALRDPGLTREFDRLEALSAGELRTTASLERLEEPLDSIRTTTAQLADQTVAHTVEASIRARSEQRKDLLGVLAGFTAMLLLSLVVARGFAASIRRPLRSLRDSARKLGSGDLAHRVELDFVTELNQVADAFNAMAEALRKSDGELTHRAFHDSLTGLANRALLFDRIGHAFARRHRAGDRDTVAVLFLDVDDFKSVNDSLGHSRGDEVLVEVGRRLRGVLRPSDTVARLGGDEFAVLLEDLDDVDAATRVAERILMVLGPPVTVAGREVDVAASVGVAVAGGDLCDADGLVRAADLAMYAAKGDGKRRYRTFEPSMLEGTVDRLALEHDLKRAILGDELELHYQPVVDMGSGRARGVEALARWNHPERGNIPPDVFIPLAEHSGTIVPLGRRLLTRACADLPVLRRGLDEPELIVAVNLSAAELLAPGLPEHILHSTEAAGITPSSLIIEITESQIMIDVDAAVARLRELVALGVNLALDDFGTGYSSLAYVRSFPLNALKIDRAFVEGVADPASEDHALVRAIISLGRTLDLRVVAEGIETEDQRRELRRLGCDRGQGYLFSRPMPARELVLEFGGRAVVGYS